MMAPTELKPPLVAVRDRAFHIGLRFAGPGVATATFRAQVRAYPGAPGAPLIDFPMGDAGNRVSVIDSSDDGDASWIEVEVYASKAAINALPRLGPRGDDQVYAWDMNVALGNSEPECWLKSPFILQEGVTCD